MRCMQVSIGRKDDTHLVFYCDGLCKKGTEMLWDCERCPALPLMSVSFVCLPLLTVPARRRARILEERDA